MHGVAESQSSRSGELKSEKGIATMGSQENGKCAHILARLNLHSAKSIAEMLVAVEQTERSNRGNCFQNIGRNGWRRLSLWNPQQW